MTDAERQGLEKHIKAHSTERQLAPRARIVPSAISVFVGQGSGLNWPVDAVHSVPPLTGAQAPSKSDQAAEKAEPTNGAVQGAIEAPSQ